MFYIGSNPILALPLDFETPVPDKLYAFYYAEEN